MLILENNQRGGGNNYSTLHQAASHHLIVNYFPTAAQPQVVYSLYKL